jgi:hypothetical protein
MTRTQKQLRAWALREALADIERAQQHADRVLYGRWRVGSGITWTTNGSNRFSGIVMRHAFTNRIQVVNSKTDKVRWIRASQVLE